VKQKDPKRVEAAHKAWRTMRSKGYVKKYVQSFESSIRKELINRVKTGDVLVLPAPQQENRIKNS
jgi:hypothetical protein